MPRPPRPSREWKSGARPSSVHLVHLDGRGVHTPLVLEALRQAREINDAQLGEVGDDLLARRPRRTPDLKPDGSAQDGAHDTKPEQLLQASPPLPETFILPVELKPER